MSRYKTYVCGPYDCPNDPLFEHESYFGCVPKDFKQATGKSRTNSQRLHVNKWMWDGGCDLHSIIKPLDARRLQP